MLDIPALALGLAAVVMFASAVDRATWWRTVGAGLLAALAMQTKYTMLLIPPVIGWYGLSHARIRFAAIAIATAMLVFAGWEGMLVEKYGRSHFRYHASAQQAELAPGESRLAALVAEKIDLLPGLLGDFGCLGAGGGIDRGGCAAHSTTMASDWRGAVAGWLRLCLPGSASMVRSPSFAPTGRCSVGCSSRRSVDAPSSYLCESATDLPSVLMPTRFSSLAGSRWNWPGYFALTPFPACTAGDWPGGGRWDSRSPCGKPNRKTFSRGATAAGWCDRTGYRGWGDRDGDRYSRRLPREVLRPASPAATSDRPVGQRSGMRGTGDSSITASERECGRLYRANPSFTPGAYLVLPIHPDPLGFDRPTHRPTPIQPPANVATPIAEVVSGRLALRANHPELLRRCQPGRGPRTSALARDDLPDLGRMEAGRPSGR